MHTRHPSWALVRLPLFFFGAWLMSAALPAIADPAVPPLELLFSPESRLFSAELSEINPAGRLIFKREKVYGKSKDVPEFVEIAATARALQRATVGEHYIVGYTSLSYDKQYPQGLTPSRKGYILISSSGLDPALFVDAPDLRRILQQASTEHGRESKKLRRLLLQTFAEDAPTLQRLAAGQLAIDTEMSSKLSEKEKLVLQQAALNEQINPTTRSLLITAAADRPADFGPWAAEAINKVLEITPVGGYADGAADSTGLILLAFDEASDRKVQVPIQSLTRWLPGSQQLYLERASRLLELLYPERRKSAFEVALRDSTPGSPAQRFLEGKLREFDQHDVETHAKDH
ncbi:MAG: hypothetical protein IPP82_08190 [Xanthomonadales bacterium]|nr:hypothetical protein [Xanthomonadales bacterium]